jgi:CheY-like chemotaxis protein
VKDEKSDLRAARAQAAIVRTLTGEMQRERRGDGESDLRAQAIEESARLVSVLEGLSKARSDALPSPRGGPAPEHDGARQGGRQRVLVVEDDDASRTAIAQGLAPNYDVVTAVDGLEGLKVASEGMLVAIISDIQMPRMDGIEMVERIRNLRAPAAIPVIFLTAETSPDRVVAGFSAGGTSYLVKPIDLDLLDQELRLVLGF